MQPNSAVNSLPLCFIIVLIGAVWSASATAQQNKCREHVISMARIVTEYQQTTEMLANYQEELEELESRAGALTEEEQERFLEVRSEVVELNSQQQNLFSAIRRKSKHVTESCTE